MSEEIYQNKCQIKTIKENILQTIQAKQIAMESQQAQFLQQ